MLIATAAATLCLINAMIQQIETEHVVLKIGIMLAKL
jgi:hypothetical protein